MTPRSPVAPEKRSTEKAILPGVIAPLSCVYADRARGDPVAELLAVGLAIRTARRRWPAASVSGITRRTAARLRPCSGVMLLARM